MSSISFNSKVLDYYYQRRAESSIGIGDRFLITQAVFGSSSLVKANASGTYDFSPIPANFALSNLKTQFSIVEPTLSYADEMISIRADLDASQMTAEVNYVFNTIVLLDNAGLPIIVMCVQQDTLYVGKAYSAVINLSTTDS